MALTSISNLLDGIFGGGIATQPSFRAIFTPFVLEEDFYTRTKNIKDDTGKIIKQIESPNASIEKALQDPYWYTFIDPTMLAVVSSRVMRVTPPKVDFNINMKSLGIVKYPVVTGLSYEQFSVTFLETEQFTIKTWLSAWTQSLFAKDLTIRSLTGRMLQLTITTTDREDRPNSVDVYPRIIPSSQVIPDYDMNGNEVLITVNFMRIPLFDIPKDSLLDSI